MSSTTREQVYRPTPPPAPVSFEEFLAWDDEGARAEWVDGEIILMSPNNEDKDKESGTVPRMNPRQ